MKRTLAFLKATLLGGLIVVLPAWLAVLLVLKALGHLEVRAGTARALTML